MKLLGNLMRNEKKGEPCPAQTKLTTQKTKSRHWDNREAKQHDSEAKRQRYRNHS